MVLMEYARGVASGKFAKDIEIKIKEKDKTTVMNYKDISLDVLQLVHDPKKFEILMEDKDEELKITVAEINYSDLYRLSEKIKLSAEGYPLTYSEVREKWWSDIPGGGGIAEVEYLSSDLLHKAIRISDGIEVVDKDRVKSPDIVETVEESEIRLKPEEFEELERLIKYKDLKEGLNSLVKNILKNRR